MNPFAFADCQTTAATSAATAQNQSPPAADPGQCLTFTSCPLLSKTVTLFLKLSSITLQLSPIRIIGQC